MLMPTEIEWISKTFLKQVTSGETRSKIMRVATVLSADEDEPEDTYWHLIGFYMDPKNQDDLDDIYNEISVDEVFDTLIKSDKKP
jgi:hypothetical protein